MSGGGSIGFFRGVIKELVSDIESLKYVAHSSKPSLFGTVFVLFEQYLKIYGAKEDIFG